MEQIWWSRVPNALAFSSDIIESIVNEKSILLHSNHGIPWYPSFIKNIHDRSEERMPSKRFNTIDGKEDPGPYLLHEYCKKEKRASYRPNKTHAKFFAQSDDIVLHNMFFLVNIPSERQLASWQSFVADYIHERPKEKEKAVFLLVWKGQKPTTIKKGIRLFSFDDRISDYDRIVFSTLASSFVSEPALLKGYLTELSAILLSSDIELCGNCLHDYRAFLEDPVQHIKSIVATETRHDGTSFVFNIDSEEKKRRIWQAQIRSIYPHLEQFRQHFIARHYSEIQKQLPINSSYGEICNMPEDVELGTLVYMVGIGKLSLSDSEYKKLKIYKDARNTLSHLNILTLHEILNLCS